LLVASGVDEKRNAVEWRMAASPLLRYALLLVVPLLILAAIVCAFAAGAYAALRFIVLLLPLIPMPYGVWSLVRVARVQIGIDGLVLRSAVRRRFIAFREIADVSQSASGERVVIVLAGGKRVTLMPAYLDENNRVAPSVTRARQFCALLRTHLDSRSKASDAEALRGALERRREPLAEWRRRLHQLVHGGYREHAVHADDLGIVLDDASATASQRIGAALALAEERSPEFGRRLRIAADRCAEPRLRIVLERVAEGEIEDLEPLLDELALEQNARVR
jgi:hypothetical protein